MLDGWTTPLVSSYLGLVIVWHANGKIHHAILEFIWSVFDLWKYFSLMLVLSLTKSHTGEYLAEVTAKCLKCYGLAKFMLFSILNSINDLLLTSFSFWDYVWIMQATATI